MHVTLDLPADLVRYLGQDACSLPRAAVEALVLEGVRSRKVSAAQARRLLGFRTCDQIDAFLKAHGVELPITIDQVRRDSETALSSSE